MFACGCNPTSPDEVVTEEIASWTENVEPEGESKVVRQMPFDRFHASVNLLRLLEQSHKQTLENLRQLPARKVEVQPLQYQAVHRETHSRTRLEEVAEKGQAESQALAELQEQAPRETNGKEVGLILQDDAAQRETGLRTHAPVGQIDDALEIQASDDTDGAEGKNLLQVKATHSEPLNSETWTLSRSRSLAFVHLCHRHTTVQEEEEELSVRNALHARMHSLNGTFGATVNHD